MPKLLPKVALVLCLIALVAAPQWASSQPYLLHMLVLACVLVVPAVGLNLMLGYSGLVSLGHMGFAGIGAYVAAVLMVDAHWGFWSALTAATLVAGGAGALIGLVCFRFRGHFFMIVTLAFGLMLHAVMNNWDAVTRGAAGFAGHTSSQPDPLGRQRLQFRPAESFLLCGTWPGLPGFRGAVRRGALAFGAHSGGHSAGRTPWRVRAA